MDAEDREQPPPYVPLPLLALVFMLEVGFLIFAVMNYPGRLLSRRMLVSITVGLLGAIAYHACLWFHRRAQTPLPVQAKVYALLRSLRRHRFVRWMLKVSMGTQLLITAPFFMVLIILLKVCKVFARSRGEGHVSGTPELSAGYRIGRNEPFATVENNPSLTDVQPCDFRNSGQPNAGNLHLPFGRGGAARKPGFAAFRARGPRLLPPPQGGARSTYNCNADAE